MWTTDGGVRAGVLYGGYAHDKLPVYTLCSKSTTLLVILLHITKWSGAAVEFPAGTSAAKHRAKSSKFWSHFLPLRGHS